MKTLVLSPRFDEDSQALWRAATDRGWPVIRPHWDGPALSVESPVVYAGAMLGPMLAERVGVQLHEPPADWLVRLPAYFRQRLIALTTLERAREMMTETFVKPPNEKSFPAAIYTGATLPTDFDNDMPVLVAEVVQWETEFRCFILDRRVTTSSRYAVRGERSDAALTDDERHGLDVFMDAMLSNARVDLPRAAVVDVGIIAGRGWACVEQNAAWSAAVYGCAPAAVLDVVAEAQGE